MISSVKRYFVLYLIYLGRYILRILIFDYFMYGYFFNLLQIKEL